NRNLILKSHINLDSNLKIASYIAPCRGSEAKLHHDSITALAAAKFFHGSSEVFLCKVGPQFRRDIHLCVGRLPEKEIGQAHLARSANKEAGIRIVPGVKMFAEHLHIDHCPIDVTQLDRAKQTLDAIDNFEATPITQGENESQTSIASSLFDGSMKLLLRTHREGSQAAGGLKAHGVLDQFRRLFLQEFF